MTAAKITLLAAATLWSSAVLATETESSATRLQARFALSDTEKKACTASLRWSERCHIQHAATASLGPAIATLSAAQPESLARQAFTQPDRPLLARFAQD
ncbi:hypothetical protein GWD52_13005 [Enterobacteriaceae bacterium 4M9]|nr:hypothetical protein [Enterobacteriaceae bacterium 4M9]